VQIFGWFSADAVCARFSSKSRQGLRISRHIFRQEFQCDVAIQPRVLSLVHSTHTSAAEAFKDAVVRNSLADERVGTRHGALNLGCALKQVNERHPSDPGPCHQFTGEVFLAFLLSD